MAISIHSEGEMTAPPGRSAGPEAPPWTLYSGRQSWCFLAVLFLVTTSNYFDYYVLSVLLDPIKQEFHVSDTMLGLLGGFGFAVVYAIASVPIARWADAGNRRSVITFTLACWSVLTVLCGLTQAFWQLLLVRVGVGAAEPGAIPPAQSLIADYFPPGRRATPIAVLTAGGGALGWIVGVGLGGYVAATHGWRMAFWVAGVPGIALVAIVRLTLAEPRIQLGFPGASDKESMSRAIAQLVAKRSFILTILGISLYAIFCYGIAIFLPSFMLRSLHATLEQVSTQWGFAIAGANLIGAVAGGPLADRLSQRDARWYVWLPAIAFMLGLPLYWLALSAHTLLRFIGTEFLAEAVLATGVPACFAGMLVVCGNARRTLALSIIQFSFMLLGSGIGPLMVGMLSDALSSSAGMESLRYSMRVMLAFLIPAAAALYCAGRSILRDLED